MSRISSEEAARRALEELLATQRRKRAKSQFPFGELEVMLHLLLEALENLVGTAVDTTLNHLNEKVRKGKRSAEKQ